MAVVVVCVERRIVHSIEDDSDDAIAAELFDASLHELVRCRSGSNHKQCAVSVPRDEVRVRQHTEGRRIQEYPVKT